MPTYTHYKKQQKKNNIDEHEGFQPVQHSNICNIATFKQTWYDAGTKCGHCQESEGIICRTCGKNRSHHNLSIAVVVGIICNETLKT